MKILCFAFAVLFALFAFFQHNDLGQYPDAPRFPIGWILLYVGVAAISVLVALDRPVCWHLGTAGVLLLVAALLRGRTIEWDKTVLFNDSNPSGNEAGGLLIVGLWLLTLAWIACRRTTKTSS